MSHRVGHVTSASRQCQSSHASHENVTKRPNPFQYYSQCLGNYTSWCYPAASTPPPLTIFTLLQIPHNSLRFHTPASSSPQLTIVTLLRGPQVMPPTLPSPAAYHPYACGVPSRHASDAAYHPYACIVPS
ncbi:hypothetical protein O181_037747 [Austropuccinia psidii MF-1]|uniref:Uncharacterized protein n=1 Tax=Austropuccinia psidii MF-1 TaxID=1389203 RepID=A0A9Q3DDD8_9BASI|nr:hypothetical protein [Austropuccinia psidii MF-1]